MENINLKDITKVPELESLTGAEKVLLNVDGSAKQAKVELIKPKVTKELMYEWNFSADDEVYEISENVDEDLTWLATKSDDISWEAVVTCYAMYTYEDENGDYWDCVDPDIYTTGITKSDSCVVRYQNDSNMSIVLHIDSAEDFYNNWNINYWGTDVNVYAYNNVHFDFDNDWLATDVNSGGNIGFYSYELPFKSVKIYKITK